MDPTVKDGFDDEISPDSNEDNQNNKMKQN